jgi:hypothetical protein
VEIADKDHYVVKDEIWKEAISSGPKALLVGEESKIQLCISCLEKRIGRRLLKSDFTDAKINDGVVINIH